jgi:hypothetical protein
VKLLPVLLAEQLETRDAPAVFTVTTTADSGTGSLREAITRADSQRGEDVIAFAIPTTDPGFVDANGNGIYEPGDYWSIAPLTALPAITEAVTVDGWSQPGPPDDRPVIELSGAAATGTVDGLTLAGHAGSRVRGLIINRFSGSGVHLDGGGQHRLAGNFIGTNSLGTAARSNADAGVLITSSHMNMIGGEIARQRNVISGNFGQGIRMEASVSNQVLGNLVGTNATGDTAVPNGTVRYLGDGIQIKGGGFNVIGGSTVAARNILSGNFDDGVDIRDGSFGNAVWGNYIGTKLGGRAPLGNGADGVFIQDSSGNLVGSTVTGDANVLGGNGYNGVFLYGDSHDNVISGNFIGTNSKGDQLGNGTIANFADGIFMAQFGAPVGPTNNTVSDNVIAYNADSAVSLEVSLSADVVGNTVSRNSIFGNRSESGGTAIDIGSDGSTPNDVNDPDVGVNNVQNYPVLLPPIANTDGSFTVRGTLNSLPSTSFRIEFFASGSAGQGRLYLGFVEVTTPSNGTTNEFSLTFTRPPAMKFLTATATNLFTGDTSEFSAAVS